MFKFIQLKSIACVFIGTIISTTVIAENINARKIQLGPRPFYLINNMDEGELKEKLQSCVNKPLKTLDFVIGHRGASMQFPEHTKESYQAAVKMGAGIVECDVTFTKDKELVCRHSQCDLHATTNILEIPALAAKCSISFTPADPENGLPAQARCCTSDITLAEFKTLKGKMDATNPDAITIAEYINATPKWRTDLYASNGTVLSHKESIELFKTLGVKFTPELKSPSVRMPFEGSYSQTDYAQQMINDYKEAGIPAENVFAQSFSIDDIKYWISHDADFGEQAVYLDGRYDDPAFDHTDPTTWQPSMAQLIADNVKIIAPPMWMLLALDENNTIVPSSYAKAAKAAGLEIITWTLERSGPLNKGGGWYHQTITKAINNDGDTYKVLDVLARQVGVIGVFSDWPATVSYYANCMAEEIKKD